MPSPAVARKAAATRQALDERAVELINQGTSPEDAVAQARRELNQKPLTQAKLVEAAARASVLAKTGKGRRIRFTGSTPKTPAPSTSQPSTPAQAPTTAAAPSGSPANPPATSSIRSKLAGAGLSAAAAPSVAGQTPKPGGKAVGLVPKDWETDGKFLKIMCPGTKQDILLPIEKKPGPYTPTEDIHDILGQSDMLYQVALAFAESLNVMVKGPTGVAKTVVFRWFAKKLNWNIVTAQIHLNTAPEDLVGEFLPVEQSGSKQGVAQLIKFIYSVVSKAVLASQEHPTICVLEEVNRIGNQQAFAKIYSLLDDTKQIEIPNKEDAQGLSEVLRPGKLFFGANMNPPDPGYVGPQELDVAFGRRFPIWVDVGYPPENVEAEALRRRVKGLALKDAEKMVAMATLVRQDEEVAYPLSFPDLVAWATALPYLGWDKAAEVAVVAKASPDDREGIRGAVLLSPNTSHVQP